jgi:putative transposase
MTKRKRHSPPEIAAKLAHAEELIAQGRRQQEVARMLGVSVMTFHRWRKLQPWRHSPQAPPASDQLSEPECQRQIVNLEVENTRLRRLVTDLLLEKVKLEETPPRHGSGGDSTSHSSH